MSALLLALPLLFGTPVVNGQVSVEGHGGTPQGWGVAQEGLAAELRLTPQLTLELPGDESHFEVAYAPSLTWRTRGSSSAPLFVNDGHLDWTGSLGDRVDAFANLRLRIGQEDYYRYLASAEAPAGSGAFVVPVDRLLLVNGHLGAGAEWRAAPRARLRLEGFYDASGGVDAPSQRALPLVQGPGADLRGEVDVTRRDVARLEARFSAPRYTPGPSYGLGEVTASWTRRLTPTTDLTPSVGLFSVLSARGVDVTSPLRPTGALELSQRLGLHRDFGRLRVRLEWAPHLSNLDGLPEDRFGGSLGWSWQWTPRFITSLEGGASWIAGGSTGPTDGHLYRAGLWSGYTLIPDRLRVVAGGAYYSQTLPARLGGYTGNAWDVYLGISGNIETRRGP